MVDPDNVAFNDIYQRNGKSLGEQLAPIREAIGTAVQDPEEASGWAAILIPAIVTAVAISGVRRYL